MKYMGKQEMDKGGEGKTVCKQRYRKTDGDEDLSEDAIIQREREREIGENVALQMPKW